MSNANENKRIAKNSILLYIRMFVMVMISLYTSRIVLKTLGVEDFGINNVVGGVITFLGFLTGSLAGASARFITFSLGKGDMEELKNTFGNIVKIHLLFSVIVLIISETLGLWFVMTQLNIPEGRETAAMWVYQLSILTAIGGFVCSPYNAAIIAHEKMSAFAYLTLADAILKLVAVFMLVYTPFDKLIFYAVYICIIQMFDFMVYIIYCNRKFEETKGLHIRNTDKKLFREIFSYAGWTMNGNLAFFGFTQGLNILLNIFFTTAVNAARGIAVQVQTIANTFSNNFLMALNPQLTKSYATGNMDRMHELIIISSKFSVYLMLLICIPLSLETDMVLGWWLGEYPEHTTNFVRIILMTSILSCIANPIITSVHATGRLKKFQLYESSTLLMILPISYIALKYYYLPPESVFIIHIIVEIIAQYIRLKIVLPMIGLKINIYVKDVLYKIIPVMIIAPIVPTWIYYSLEQNIMTFILVCGISVVSVVGVIYTLGLSKKEKNYINNRISALIK